MSNPVLGVEIDFSNGASFGYPLLLNDPSFGILDTNVLGDAPADIADITSMVSRVSTRRGRNRILSNFEVGTATVTLNDPNSDFNPQNTTGPYYTKLLPLRKIRIYADQDRGDSVIQRFYIFSGYITSYDTNFYVGTNATASVTLQCADGFRLLNNVSTGADPVPGATVGQLSGARVDSLLDFAGFPNSMRDLDVGDSTMQVDPGGARGILQAIQTVEQSEFGAFYMQPSGVARFLDRTDVTKLANSGVRVFSDTGTGLPYTNLDSAFDDQLIINDVTVTALGGVAQNVSDATSIAKFFTKSGQRSDILVQSNLEANNQARMLLVARKNAELRIDSMDLNLSTGANNLNVAGLTTDIYRLIYIIKSMPGGSTIEKELFVQGVQHDVTPSTWTTRFITQEPLIQGFILDAGPANNPNSQGVLGEMSPIPNTNALSY